MNANLVADPPRLSRPPVRPPVKTHGGKFYLIQAHLEAISWCCDLSTMDLDVDGCGGGGTYGISSPSSWILYNDLDPKKYNLFWCLRDKADEFMDAIRAVTFSQERWEEARYEDDLLSLFLHPGSYVAPIIDDAVNFVVRSRMSRGGLGKAFGRSTRQRGGNPECLNAWLTSVAQLPRVAARINPWLLYNMPIQELIANEIAQYTRTRWYLDPPYMQDTRSARKVYEYEMSPEQHAQMIRGAKACKGTVAICGYHSALYDQELADWTLFEWPVKNNSGQGKIKQNRVECLWINRPVWRRAA